MSELVSAQGLLSDNPAALASLIILLPLVGAGLLLFFGRRLNRVAGLIGSATVALAFAASVITFFELLSHPAGHGEHGGRSGVLTLFEWISVGDFRVAADLLVDELSVVMLLVVTGVGTLIHIYSIGYTSRTDVTSNGSR